MKDKTERTWSAVMKTNRREALKGLGLGALGLSSLGFLTEKLSAATTNGLLSLAVADQDLLNFALNLEYLEAEFFTRATLGTGIGAQGVPVTGLGVPGSVTVKANPLVPFATTTVRQYAVEIGAEELSHVKLLRAILGSNAIARPALDFTNSFNTMAQAAGIVGAGGTFDPFADEAAFLVAAAFFEDLGVTAYRGVAQSVSNRTALAVANGLQGAEAYHAATVRTKAFEASTLAQIAIQKIADLENSLDGSSNASQGVVLTDTPNISPLSANALTFARTPVQVRSVLCLAPDAVTGGFFPNGMNSRLRTAAG